MDFFWMNKWQDATWISGGVAVVFAMGALMFYRENVSSEMLLLSASFIWVLMNLTWVLGEDLGYESVLGFARILFAVCLILIIFAIHASRKENKQIDFKRLKIK